MSPLKAGIGFSFICNTWSKEDQGAGVRHSILGHNENSLVLASHIASLEHFAPTTWEALLEVTIDVTSGSLQCAIIQDCFDNSHSVTLLVSMALAQMLHRAYFPKEVDMFSKGKKSLKEETEGLAIPLTLTDAPCSQHMQSALSIRRDVEACRPCSFFLQNAISVTAAS